MDLIRSTRLTNLYLIPLQIDLNLTKCGVEITDVNQFGLIFQHCEKLQTLDLRFPTDLNICNKDQRDIIKNMIKQYGQIAFTNIRISLIDIKIWYIIPTRIGIKHKQLSFYHNSIKIDKDLSVDKFIEFNITLNEYIPIKIVNLPYYLLVPDMNRLIEFLRILPFLEQINTTDPTLSVPELAIIRALFDRIKFINGKNRTVYFEI